jgi:hypothetical protein
MSGYDKKIKRNTSLNLMAGRFGIYDGTQERPDDSEKENTTSNLDGLKDQILRLHQGGGYLQQDRMIADKKRSLDRALLYSYQACTIKRIACTDNMDNTTIYPNVNHLNNKEICRALINPDKNKMDYDDKIVSVPYEDNYHPGDVFEWVGTNTYWMIYLQELEERAYFRGEIRKCSHQINWEDENGEHSTYAAIRGPVETKINYIQKHQISVDTPNYSLDIYIPRNKETLSFFRRYQKFYLQSREEGGPIICWRVEAVDWISTPGILEVTAVEYYINETEDDLEKGIVGGLKVDPIDPNKDLMSMAIEGPTFIKPKQPYEYYCKGFNSGAEAWSVDTNKYPVEFKVDPKDPMHIKLIWFKSYHGQFELKYGNYSKTIVVESLF